MKDEYIRRLQRNRETLVREIDPVGLWTRLYQEEVITRHHVDMCKSMPTVSDQLEVLLDKLELRDDIFFEKFCSVVRHNNPELVKKYLERDTIEENTTEAPEEPSPNSWPREVQLKILNLERENEKLCKKLNRINNVKTWLEKDTRSNEMLTRFEHEKLREIKEKIDHNQRKYKTRRYELTSREANREKLELTMTKLKASKESLENEIKSTADEIVRLAEELETARLKNDQLRRELVEVKRTNANSLDIADQLPSNSFLSLLPPQDLHRLDTNQQFIMEACGDLNRRELIPVICDLDSSQSRSIDLERESVDQLFNTIRSFSPDNYDSFIASLRKLHRHHIADVLDYGGVAIKLLVAVRIDETVRRRNPIGRLNDFSNQDIINSAFEKCGCAKVKFLCARLSHPTNGRTIELWVWCLSVDGLRTLKHALTSRSLLKEFENLFSHPSIGIRETGFLGMISSSGKPTSVVFENERQLTNTFCPCLPYGRIVRELPSLVPDTNRRVAIIGVASMNDKAYILSAGSTEIRVYHLENSVYKEDHPTIQVPDLKNPVDMTGHGSWLFVLERENELFWKVSVSGSPSSLPPRKCEIGVMANSLSVTPDGQLLLCVRGSRNLLILCRSEDGRPIREISLPSSTDSVWHGLVSGQGEFIVIHRYEGSNQVALLNCNGRTRKDYSGGTRLPGLGAPVHLTLDDDGQIFVVDQSNRRILYFDPELQSVRILIRFESGKPNRIHFNQDNGHLLVGLDNGQVEIYSVNETKYLEPSKDNDQMNNTERDSTVLNSR